MSTQKNVSVSVIDYGGGKLKCIVHFETKGKLDHESPFPGFTRVSNKSKLKMQRAIEDILKTVELPEEA